MIHHKLMLSLVGLLLGAYAFGATPGVPPIEVYDLCPRLSRRCRSTRREGGVIGFADDPNFRDLWRDLLRLFANAVFLGPHF